MSSFYTPPNVSGLDTQIQYNEDGVLSASSDLTWDNTNKELDVSGDINVSSAGIGTTFTTSLQIQDPTSNRTITFPDATGTLALVAGSDGYVTYNSNGSNAGDIDFTFSTVTGLSLNKNFRIGVGGTVITANSTTGRVGIGSTLPKQKLDVGGNLYVSSQITVGVNSAPVVRSDTTGIGTATQVTNIMSLTQADYDAITPDSSTFYIII